MEQMLRIDFMQRWFHLLGPGLVDAFYGMEMVRLFAGINWGR